MAKATGWGYRRIVGELKKLRIFNVSRATVSRILQENGFDLGPKRGRGIWHEFIESLGNTQGRFNRVVEDPCEHLLYPAPTPRSKASWSRW